MTPWRQDWETTVYGLTTPSPPRRGRVTADEMKWMVETSQSLSGRALPRTRVRLSTELREI